MKGQRTLWMIALLIAGSGLCAVHAGVRAGVNYDVLTESVTAGGGRMTNGLYAVDAALGELGGGWSSVISPTEANRHGFIGQLYEVTGISLSATPATINEEQSRQVSATADLDDASCLVLLGNEARWSIVQGPLVSVSTQGLVAAGAVYQDATGTVQAAYQTWSDGLDLTVLNIDPDNYGLYARDGLPDNWQVRYFGFDYANGAPGADPDEDGQNNNMEYVAGTYPTSGLSRFNLRIAAVSGQTGRMNVMFNPRWNDRTYTLVARTNLLGSAGWVVQPGLIADNGQERTVTDTNAIGVAKFYRIGIRYP